MSIIQSIPIELSADQIKNTVLTNTIKMLTKRKLLLETNLQKNIDYIIQTNTNDFLYKIMLENKRTKENDINHYIIKVMNQKITAVNRASSIGEFLHQYKTEHKIVIVKNINNKARQFIMNMFPFTEIFLERELMINLPDHISVPHHELLTDEEAEQVNESYNARKRDMPKIFTSDPMARYYNMKVGQICRILRPSETSGLVPFYRLVIKGHISTD